ncbi:hypothetical protein AAFF_G00321060 [Aldrovandia affinis]|uniref:NACHT domain-containing protein n=1 Tax=Aldrovandia affinis TaxID=143900 RepID=A0AAD7R743_9TELE|nr:hypothetical protein AAFF_G00321060 [Aldrovandia affinis]
MKGAAGIGKTVCVQKFILDWAEGKANQDVSLIFLIPFCKIDLGKGKECSLRGLLQSLYPEMKECEPLNLSSCKILFIFDGLKEGCLPLNFKQNERLCDETKTSSVDVLLTNLISGNLLPSALLWITARPAAANQIPSDYIHRATEVQGFDGPRKEEYFRKRLSDQNLANRILAHVRTSRSLNTMCHIPAFCSMTATVLEGMFRGAGTEPAQNMTQICTHFLILQSNMKNHKGPAWVDYAQGASRSVGAFLLKMGELAFQHLEEGNDFRFHEEELRQCGIGVGDVSDFSWLCEEIVQGDSTQPKAFRFTPFCLKEYLAALHVFFTFRSDNKNLLDKPGGHWGKLNRLFRRPCLSDFLKRAVDQALESEDGRLDLFLRFLLGLSQEPPNHSLLRGLVPPADHGSRALEETVKHIKGRIGKSRSPERSIDLVHCLSELRGDSLEEEIQRSLRAGRGEARALTPMQCSLLAYVLLTSGEASDVFDLKKYVRSDEGLVRLLPVVRHSRKAL